MFLYLVKRTAPCSYDEFDGHVVVAPDPQTARLMCSIGASDEGPACWLDDQLSTVTAIASTDYLESQILLSSFNAG